MTHRDRDQREATTVKEYQGNQEKLEEAKNGFLPRVSIKNTTLPEWVLDSQPPTLWKNTLMLL